MLLSKTTTYWDYIKFDLNVKYLSEHLTIPVTLLCTAPSHIPVNTKEVAEYIKQWALNLKLTEPDNKLLRPELVQGSASAFRKASMDNLKIYSCFALLILLLDDILDEAWQTLGNKENVAYILKLFLDALAGKTIKPDYVNANLQFPKANLLRAAFADIHAKLIQQQLDMTYFLLSMEKFFNYLLKEFDYRRNYSKLSLEEYLKIRAIVGGLDPSCELAYLLQKIEPSANIRNNADFLLLKDQAYKALIIANDLLSLSKEIKQGNISDNYILIKQANEQIALKTIIQEFQYLYNTMVIKLTTVKSQLLADAKINDRHTLLAAILIIEEQLQAHLDWALQTARYQENQLNITRINKANLTSDEIMMLFGK